MIANLETVHNASPAVVIELNDVVIIAVFLSIHHHFEERVIVLCSIDHHATFEEPVTTVLTVQQVIKSRLSGVLSSKETDVHNPRVVPSSPG